MIAESQLHLTRLKKIISEMARDAQDTNLARDVLASYAAALTRHEAQRRLIVSMMDASPSRGAQGRAKAGGGQQRALTWEAAQSGRPPLGTGRRASRR